MATARPKVLNYDLLPETVKRCEYAVRGELYLAATKRVAAGKEVRGAAEDEDTAEQHGPGGTSTALADGLLVLRCSRSSSPTWATPTPWARSP